MFGWSEEITCADLVKKLYNKTFQSNEEFDEDEEAEDFLFGKDKELDFMIDSESGFIVYGAFLGVNNDYGWVELPLDKVDKTLKEVKKLQKKFNLSEPKVWIGERSS